MNTRVLDRVDHGDHHISEEYLPAGASSLRSDRQETVLWTTIMGALAYGIAQTGFQFSPGTSLLIGLSTGVIIYSRIGHLAKQTYLVVSSSIGGP